MKKDTQAALKKPRGRGRPKTEPTVQIRAYAADVAKLVKRGATQAEAVRALLQRKIK